MQKKTLQAAAAWISGQLDSGDSHIEITFHGGEPLLAGVSYFRHALSWIQGALPPGKVRFSLQSNLWLLTDELCRLMGDYGVSIGTSLDGPREITDGQRGSGYFSRTTEGIRRAERYGLKPGAICTFTGMSSSRVKEIFEFFLREERDLTIHGAVPVLGSGSPGAAGTITPAAYGNLLVALLDLYVSHADRIRISTLDSLIRSVSRRRGGVCTFVDCLGDYLAIGPDGDIFPCQRFVGHRSFCLGSVMEGKSLEQLALSPVWKALQALEEQVKSECGDCLYFDFCRGGCPYNALASGGTAKDPYCSSYRRIFASIKDRALQEVFSEENLAHIEEEPGISPLRTGRILSLMGEGDHPRERRRKILSVLYGAALGMDAAGAPEKLVEAGVAPTEEAASMKLEKLSRMLVPSSSLNNLYIHVTFACNLSCTHCYADAGSSTAGCMAVDTIEALCREASGLGFRQAVITGGEPLLHPEREQLLDALASVRNMCRPMTVVLRTNLSLPVSDRLAERLQESFDQIAISIDGDRAYHDRRRGKGSYDCTVRNLEALIRNGYAKKISITAVMSLDDAMGPAGQSLRALARGKGITRLHFKPVLPLGRALVSEPDQEPETHWVYVPMRDAVAYGFAPAVTCGIGQNLYVAPDGAAFPCYAYRQENRCLGHLGDGGSLGQLINSPPFRALSSHTVDTNRKCRLCVMRYLCGGACRAWSRDTLADFDHPPADCERLHHRAVTLLTAALHHAGISEEAWRAAGLIIPVSLF